MFLYHKESESQAKIIGIDTFSQAGKGMAGMLCCRIFSCLNRHPIATQIANDLDDYSNLL